MGLAWRARKQLVQGPRRKAEINEMKSGGRE